MKSKIIKRIAGICSGGLAGVLVVGAILNAVMPVRAEETLFGIESLKQEVQSRGTAYRILEIVPDEDAAEIGYYIPGYEPALSERQEQTGQWLTWEEGLAQYRTFEERQEYIQKLVAKLETFYAARGFSGNDVPIAYKGYTESEEPENGYTKLDFEALERKGYFQLYTGADGTKRYTLDFEYIGNWNESDVTGDVTTEIYYVSDVTPITTGMMGTLQDSTVLYQYVSADGAERFDEAGTWGELKSTVSGGDAVETISSGDARVSTSDGDAGGSTPDDDSDELIGYYQVKTERWQQGMTPAYLALYEVSAFAENADGAYEFVNDENAFAYSFATDSVYYKGGFVNNEWFHRNVVNLEMGMTENFPVEVITLTVDELKKMSELPTFDMLYLNSGMQKFAENTEITPYSVDNDIDESLRLNLFKDVIVEGKPCIVDSAILFATNSQGGIGPNISLQQTQIFHLSAMLLQESPLKYYEDKILETDITEQPTVGETFDDIADDDDKNFVVEQVYSFYAPESLVGPNFAVFDIYKDGTTAEGKEQGFLAVLDEIISENLNRGADSSGAYKPLPKDVSQATVVRHIMNYSNRRQIEVKKNLRVLEIQPTKSKEGSYDLTEKEIMDWAPEVESVQIDRMTTAEFIGKIEDINEVYDLVYIGTDRDYLNTVNRKNYAVTLNAGEQSTGFEDGTKGWGTWGTVEVTDDSNHTIKGNALKMESDSGIWTPQFIEVQAGATYRLSALGKAGVDGAKGEVGIDFMNGTTDDNVVEANAKILEFSSTEYEEKSTETFTVAAGTTHIKIYASATDTMYFDEIKLEETVDVLDSTAPGNTVFNDSSMNGLIYFHTGDMRYSTIELAGQLNTEYLDEDRAQNVYYYNPVRYGGNDITDDKRKALLSFLDASYPIIVSDEFFQSPASIFEDANYGGYHVDLEVGRYDLEDLQRLGINNDSISSIKVADGYRVTIYWDYRFGGTSAELQADVADMSAINGVDWENKVSSLVVERSDDPDPTRQISEIHIDNSSYMYEFIEAAMKKTNFYTRSEIGNDSDMFKFYLNRPKVHLDDNLEANGIQDVNGIYQISPVEDDRYMLEYKFTIRNEGAASADTRYRCELFIDVNADGKYSEGEVLGDVTITQNGKAVSYDNLYADREYVLTRYVPDGYKGVLPWKIQISQINNPNIHTGATGYTKLLGLERETLRILQICRDVVTEKDWWGGESEVLFNLEDKILDENDIYHVLIYGGEYDGVSYEGIYNDFDIDVDFMVVPDFEKEFAEDPLILNEYNMLILGFSDAYGDLTDGPASAIVEFIESGKSVLFAHDTVSYWNYEKAKSGIINRNETSQTAKTGQYHNSYNLSKWIRGLVGMDRYGITSLPLLKEGDDLYAGTPEWDELMKQKKEVAYVPRSNRQQSYGLTHGYTYSIINAKDVDDNYQNYNGPVRTFIPEQTGLTDNFSNTYLNLDYGTVYYHDDTTDNGEIPSGYNGEVSKLWVTKVNDGQITQYPYELEDEFQVSNTHGQYYQLDFMADDDIDEQTDLVVWYCLGYRAEADGSNRKETIYSLSPNDVSNNYYIFNKGNITYTGVGHAGNTSTVEEAKLFINTMIASYSAGIKDPVIATLSDGTGDAKEINAAYRYYDEINDIYMENVEETTDKPDGKEKVYFTVSDLNFVKGTREIAVRCYYESKDADAQKIVYDGRTISVKPFVMEGNSAQAEIYNASTDQKVEDIDNLASGGIYYILIDEDFMGDYMSKFSVYFEVQSTIKTYKNVYETGKAYQKFDFTRVQLFDLE